MFSEHKKIKVATRLMPLSSQVIGEDKRIVGAVKSIKKPFDFKLEELDKVTLQKITNLTNRAKVHCTPNCPLLAISLLYNLKMGRAELSGKNVFPFHKPISSSEVSQVFFGTHGFLIQAAYEKTIPALSNAILDTFKKHGERVFFIYINYNFKLFGIPAGHCLNAIVVGEKETIKIWFADAWKKTVYTASEFEKKYLGNYTFTLQRYVGEIPRLQKVSDMVSSDESDKPKSVTRCPEIYSSLSSCPRPLCHPALVAGSGV